MEFAPDSQMRKVSAEAREFFERILRDEKPLFVSDEATVLDISTSAPEELIARCAAAYGKELVPADLTQPLWKLLKQLNK